MLGRQLSHMGTTASPRCAVGLTQRSQPAHCGALHRSQDSSGGVQLSSGKQTIHSAAFRAGSLRSCGPRYTAVRAAGNENSGSQDKESKPFGYTRKDVILLGGGVFGVGYGLYYGLQAAGFDALVAGNIVQIFVFLGIGVGYISTYIFRVANKEMTYVKQLEDYEEAVMQKRLDEMPQAERERILGEIEQQKQSNGQQAKK